MTKNEYFGPNLAVFGPKILIFMGVSKSFGTNITENHLDNLSALFFGQALDQMGQKCRYLAPNAGLIMFEDIKVRRSPRRVQGGEHSSQASLRLLQRLGWRRWFWWWWLQWGWGWGWHWWLDGVSFVTVTPNKKVEVWLHLRVRKWETWLISSSRLALRLGPSLSPRSYFYISLLVSRKRLIAGVNEQMIWSCPAIFSSVCSLF